MFGVRLGLRSLKTLHHVHTPSVSRIKPIISEPIIKSRIPSFKSFSTMPTSETPKKFTILDLQQKYTEQKPLTMVTAYDYTSAILVDRAGIDLILGTFFFSLLPKKIPSRRFCRHGLLGP